MGKLVGELLDRLGLQDEVAAQGAVARWEEVVGPRIAEVSRATGVDRGALFVAVSSSAWISELSLMRHELLTRLNAGVKEGRVERIVFILDEEGGR